MLTTIHVTAEDIAAGKQSDCQRCPIALAFKRSTKHEFVEVGMEGISVYNKPIDELTHKEIMAQEPISLPDEAKRFISLFDSNELMSPTSFQLDIPDHLLA